MAISQKLPHISVHCADYMNTGDLWSAPHHYFDFLQGSVELDTREWDVDSVLYTLDRYIDLVEPYYFKPGALNHLQIFGGGGLFYEACMRTFLEMTCSREVNPLTKLVAWGAGMNQHAPTGQVISGDVKGNVTRFVKGCKVINGLPEKLEEWDLVGIRDYDCGYEWVPCASCMSPLFDLDYEVEHEIVIYEHTSFKVSEVIDTTGFKVMVNGGNSLVSVLKFMGSGEVVVTSTYHGVYWATLLGKRVVVFEPFSTKFNHLKHKHPMATSKNWTEKIRESQSYPNALQECRISNIRFSEKVKELVNNENQQHGLLSLRKENYAGRVNNFVV